MNTKSIFCALYLVPAVVTSMLAHGVTIEGTFKGSVTEAQSFTGDLKPIWSKNIVGKSMSGSFWYDTELASDNKANRENEAIYFSRQNWIGMIFNIDGKTFDLSQNDSKKLPVTDIVDVITLSNHVPAVNGDSLEDMSIFDSSIVGDESADFVERSGSVSFSDSTVDVLHGIGPLQEFDWVDNSDVFSWSSYGSAYFVSTSSLKGKYAYLQASMDISEVHASIRDTSVPEPSSLMLLGIALLGLGWRYHK